MNREQAQRYLDKFLSKVEKTETCWLWKGVQDGFYGTLYTKSGAIRAHRLSYLLFKGEIPQGAFICHDCPGKDNPRCVNPDHLWIGNDRENRIDFYNKCDGLKKDEHKEIIRIRLEYEVYKRFQILCVELNISPNKQILSLVEQFVCIQEENLKIQKHLKKMSKE